MNSLRTAIALAGLIAWGAHPGLARHPVPREHPRLLGSSAELKSLAATRGEAYRRVVAVARAGAADDHSLMLSQGLVYAIDGDEQLGQQAKQSALKYVRGPILHGHVPFGHDLARCALVYDLCFPCWTNEEREEFHEYFNFLIYKHTELAGDGGHYDSFGSPHDVNYHLRSIAHNTLLVFDPNETWSGIRGVTVNGNDGGQSHAWRHHNGAFEDVDDWKSHYQSAHVGQMLAVEDRTDYLYVAGDASRAYAPHKLDYFTRQIVFLRPDTFVIFDRTRSTDASFRKAWLLQAMQVPAARSPHWVITNGPGRLFVQTLLPEEPTVRLVSGEDLYRYGNRTYPPQRDTGPAPECRIEVSPSVPAETDYFLHVLTTADSETQSVPVATVRAGDGEFLVTLADTQIGFTMAHVGGHVERAGQRREFDRELPHAVE